MRNSSHPPLCWVHLRLRRAISAVWRSICVTEDRSGIGAPFAVEKVAPKRDVGMVEVDHYPKLETRPVRMLVPPIGQRREIDRQLASYFQNHRPSMFRRAISNFCGFYGVKRPHIQWFEYIDWGRTAGRTFEDGRIHLVHPENWKRCRVYNSERMWVQTVYHELGHYVFWSDAERKAEAFTLRMVRGLRRSLRRARPSSNCRQRSRRGSLGRRPARYRIRHPSAPIGCSSHNRRSEGSRKRCA